MAKQRAYGSATLRLGLVSVGVKLVPARRPVKERTAQFNRGCPTHAADQDAVKLEARYICPEDDAHGPFTADETISVTEIEANGDKALVLVSDEEKEGIKTSDLEKGDFTLRVYPAAEVEAKTRPADAVYRIRPETDTDPSYALLKAIFADPDRAFIGELNLRDNQKLYRLQVWNGQIVAQELIRPDDLAEMDDLPETDVDEKLLAQANMLVETLQEEFDPEEFQNEVAKRAAEFEAAKAEDPEGATAVPERKVKKPADDLETQLAAALAAAPKAAKKKKAA